MQLDSLNRYRNQNQIPTLTQNIVGDEVCLVSRLQAYIY